MRSVVLLLLLCMLLGVSSFNSVRERHEENVERRGLMNHANESDSFLDLPDYGVEGARGDTGGGKNSGGKPLVPLSEVKGRGEFSRNDKFRDPPNDDFTFIKDGLFTGSCEYQGTFEFEIEIERDVGNLSNLLATGSIKETMLLEGGAYFRGDLSKLCNKVSFNNRTVRYFNGIEDDWSQQRAVIDTNWINFASFKNGVRVPGVNTVRITLGECGPIVIRNEPPEESSCVVFDDWIAINLRRSPSLPILLLHGISSSSTVWAKIWHPQLSNRGIPHDSNFNMGKFARIQYNARLIGPRVKQLKERWGVKQVKLVCHSKGGIEARHYTEDADDVQAIIQLATPNRGSKLVNSIFHTAFALLPVVLPAVAPVLDLAGGPVAAVSVLFGSTIVDNERNTGGAFQLSPDYMRKYNRLHGLNRNVRHFIQSGDYSAKGLHLGKKITWFLQRRKACGRSKCDDTVAVDSAFSLEEEDGYSWSKNRYQCKGSNKKCRHQEIYKSLEGFNQETLQKNVIENVRPNAFIGARRALLEDNGCGDDDGDDTSMIFVMTQGGVSINNESTSVLFMVDEPTFLIMTLYFGPGEDFDFWLSTPSGSKLTSDSNTEIPDDPPDDQPNDQPDDPPDNPPDDPSNDIFDNDNAEEVIQSLPLDTVFFDVGEPNEEGEVFSYSFFITMAEVGTWTAYVTANQKESGEKPFVLSAEYVLSTLKFEAQLDRDSTPAGEPLQLTVNLFDGNEAVLKAEVIAMVHHIRGDIVATINMLDDGNGVYTAKLQLDKRGAYFIYVTAKGVRPSTNTPFSREANLFATIVARGSSIVGVDGESAIDVDLDGLFDLLSISVLVDIGEDGEYRLYGILEDSQGNEHHSGISTQLAEGKQVVMLAFDGADFVKNQVNGPFTLTAIRLADVEQGDVLGLLDELCVCYMTQTYSHLDFEVKESQRETPTAVCRGIEVSTDPGQCYASSVSINAGSSTTEGSIEGRLTQIPEGPYGPGETGVYLEVISIYGFVDSCFGDVVVKDNESPSISCNVRDITSAETSLAEPVTFVSSATDNCDDSSSISTMWTGYDCWKTDVTGERIPSPCLVQLQDDEAQIQESGGNGTSINFHVLAQDSSGNVATKICSFTVVN